MTPRETLRIAVAGITANGLRSALTVLGLAIGVASVIVLVAVGNGSRRAVAAGIDALGSNVLLVSTQTGPGGPGGFGGGSSVQLSTADASALQDAFDAPDVKSSSPVVNAASTTFVAGSVSYAPASFVGTTPSYLTARDYDVQSGRDFTQAEVKSRARVIVLGPTAATQLFSGASAVGQSVRVGGTSFQVIGVTAAKGSSGTTDADDIAFAPLTAVQDAVAGYGSIDSITVQARSGDALDAAQAEVQSILDDRLDVDASSTSTGFTVTNQASIREASEATTDVLSTLLTAVAAISLLVGGIGVMNIMLVSVTERTREIGIRKAIGARRGDVLAQFLCEALVLSLAGGVVGVLVGLGASRITIAGVQPDVVGSSIVLALAAAGLSGLVFGTSPAARGARLRPVDALRFE